MVIERAGRLLVGGREPRRGGGKLRRPSSSRRLAALVSSFSAGRTLHCSLSFPWSSRPASARSFDLLLDLSTARRQGCVEEAAAAEDDMEDDKREGSSSPPLYRQHHRLHEPYSEHNPVPTTNPLSKERLLNRKGKGKDTSKEVYDPYAPIRFISLSLEAETCKQNRPRTCTSTRCDTRGPQRRLWRRRGRHAARGSDREQGQRVKKSAQSVEE